MSIPFTLSLYSLINRLLWFTEQLPSRMDLGLESGLGLGKYYRGMKEALVFCSGPFLLGHVLITPVFTDHLVKSLKIM